MNKLVETKVFLDLLGQFFDYLEENYTMFKSDLILTRMTTNLLIKSNPRLVVEQFMDYMLPYSEHITECNDSFFLNFDNLINQDTPKNNIMFATRIKSIWIAKGTTDNEKARIWLFFQRLLKAGKRAI
jgi:hypothetical protein